MEYLNFIEFKDQFHPHTSKLAYSWRKNNDLAAPGGRITVLPWNRRSCYISVLGSTFHTMVVPNQNITLT